MTPSEFWGFPLLTIVNYVIANKKRLEFENEYNNKKNYDLAKMIATMNATNLANAFSKSSINYPKYKDFYNEVGEQIEKDKNENNGIYNKIDNTNKMDFLAKQYNAYKKMGYKF